jgi:CheY-like chemotaxis protein
MSKKLLLVDNEKFFLEGLKEGLDPYKDIFTTEICFSGNEAIKMCSIKDYDLIISDIRMPGKSGLEVFEFLRHKRYTGGFIAMTAYGTEELFEKIKKLGGLEVISKPFDFSWFRDKILDFFSVEKEGVSGTVDHIELTSLLQMINLERKSLTVEIETDNSNGCLYFSNGEIIHSIYEDLVGEAAAYHLINMKKGHFALKKRRKNVPRTIDGTFFELLISAAKVTDESGVNGDAAKKDDDEYQKNKLKKEETMDVSKLNEAAKYLKDQLGEGLLSSDVWGTADGQSLASYNTQPKAVALFNKVTHDMVTALAESEDDFVEIGRYYLVDLIGDNMVVCLYLGDYQWGILFNKKKTQLGLILNVIIPKVIDIFEEAITG